MNKIILCRGIPASGKTTWAKQWVLEDPENRIRFSNDDIRNMFGKYWVPNRESLVSAVKKEIIYEAMYKGYNIVVDNMNLNPDEVMFYERITRLSKVDENAYDLEFKDFFGIPLQDCIDRDSKRENPITADVITEIYNKYKHIIETN